MIASSVVTADGPEGEAEEGVNDNNPDWENWICQRPRKMVHEKQKRTYRNQITLSGKTFSDTRGVFFHSMVDSVPLQRTIKITGERRKQGRNTQ